MPRTAISGPQEGDNRLGPNLHNIIGRKAGSLQNYGYSSAMKGVDFVWDKEKLDRFIAKPDEVVPGKQHEAVWRAHIGRGPCQGDCVLGVAHYQLSGYVTFPILSGERIVGDGLSEVQRLIDPEARRWTLVFFPR